VQTRLSALDFITIVAGGHAFLTSDGANPCSSGRTGDALQQARLNPRLKLKTGGRPELFLCGKFSQLVEVISGFC
jgi:hypothetical protein